MMFAESTAGVSLSCAANTATASLHSTDCSRRAELGGPAGQSESAQQSDAGKAVVVQPGAPGEPSKTLPPSTRGMLPARSQADVEFMQGMIMHHAQAVEMTALIATHTGNKDLQSLGARISSSQSSEIKFMRQWLAMRGESLFMAMPPRMPTMPVPTAEGTQPTTPETPTKPGMPTPAMTATTSEAGPAATAEMMGMDMSHEGIALMPGMLTTEQMVALRAAQGAEFDRLFLIGMIQHHNGALTMVKDLFDTAGAGQDADLFNFATDADNTQRAEIRIMETMLEKKPSEK